MGWAARLVGTVLAAVLLLGTLAGCGDDGGEDEGNPDAAALRATTTGEDLAEPPRTESVDGRLQFDLVSDDRGITVAGTEVDGRAYAGALLGPTLVVRPGDTIDLTLDNRLDDHTNIHFHGLHVSPVGDGDNIFLSVEPGERFAYSLAIPDDHPPGTSGTTRTRTASPRSRCSAACRASSSSRAWPTSSRPTCATSSRWSSPSRTRR
jgi:FtsP/CotA-like multicopper oxidase with cupredoxin domain